MIHYSDLAPDEIRALSRLKSAGGTPLRKVLMKFIEDGYKHLVIADDMAKIHRTQGQIKAFEMLLEAVEDAAKIDP